MRCSEKSSDAFLLPLRGEKDQTFIPGNINLHSLFNKVMDDRFYAKHMTCQYLTKQLPQLDEVTYSMKPVHALKN